MTVQASVVEENVIGSALLPHEMLVENFKFLRLLDEVADVHHQVVPDLIANVVVRLLEYLAQDNLQL